jgi:DNA-binding HxlR family transcriptional regulator
MGFQTYDATICIMTKISRMMGGKWKPIILYLIQHEINRFGLLQRRMPKISKKILTEQLRELEHDQLITRYVHTATAPQVIVYSLTEKGTSLRKLIDAMIQWGLANLPDVYSEDFIKRHWVQEATDV